MYLRRHGNNLRPDCLLGDLVRYTSLSLRPSAAEGRPFPTKPPDLLIVNTRLYNFLDMTHLFGTILDLTTAVFCELEKRASFK